ncbi:hypothetical protein IFM89_031734 [Coptis chinensis]|uniref:Reticulon domain-containing protein n=1 Tax=Coptis chinensis TaxID=261450 RepID=A0A835H0X6_9MAGN|nr:hypothetical protein IFM89_031734 [Coptis chinensis]
MDSTPLSHRSSPRLPSKSASRLSRNDNLDETPSLTITKLPLKEFLLLSPSPQKRSRTRLIERPEMVEEPVDLVVPRRRCKSRASPMGVMGCASPRSTRRSRRRLDQESKEERELLVVLGDENVKPRKRRQTTRPRKEKSSVPPSSLSPKTHDDDESSLDTMRQLVSDLIMWKDVAKSALWFGLGLLCFLSTCFTNGLRWSIFSMISQMGLVFLAVSFFYNTFSKRNKDDPKVDFKLKEGDIARLARLAPFLLFGAEYGHLITLWRLCAIGFFISFTVPRLYRCYSVQISRHVEYLKTSVCEAWGACSHKKIIAASAATVFWNLSSVKTRIFTAFISTVILRYHRQKSAEKVVEVGVEDEQSQQPQQALVVVQEGTHA